VLDLSNNQLTSLEGLQVHSNLTELYVANNAINSMDGIKSTLRALTELVALNLYGNPLSSDQPIIKLALFHLNKLEVRHTKIRASYALKIIRKKQPLVSHLHHQANKK